MGCKLMLRQIRKEMGITQGQLADMLGSTIRKVSSWERGETKILLEDAYNCAVALGCSPNDICGWYESHPMDDSSLSLSRDEDEIVGFYRESTPEQKDMIMMSARNAALVSKSAAERNPLRRADEAAC